MVVGLDARAAILDPFRGFGRVVREWIPHLRQLLQDDLVLFLPPHASLPAPWYWRLGHVVQLRRPHRGSFLWDGPAWHLTVPAHGVEVLHLPAWGVPPGVPVPTVATFHDATALWFPLPRPWSRLRLLWGVASLGRATAIHAVSHFARRQLSQLLGHREVHVVHHGVGPPFVPPPHPVAPEHFLAVGGGEPHKNWAVVFQALAQDPQLPPLVLAGAAAQTPQLLQLRAQLQLVHRVSLRPQVSDAQLVDLYWKAYALVFPSKNEGFGLPALEAMASGCPVLAARAGALPEVCGEAAWLLDPGDPRAWREAMEAVASQPWRREELRQQGLARARLFSWEKSAQGLLALYQEAARLASWAK